MQNVMITGTGKAVGLGYNLVQEGDDIRTAMRVADERMYTGKKEYYEKYPDRRYR
jgi:hypothetical protein